MPSVSTPANTVFQYIALVYSGRNSIAKRAAKDLGVKKALSLVDGHVDLVNILNVTATERRWGASRIKDALKAYQQERFTHFYDNGTFIGVILCCAEQQDFLRQSIDCKIFPEDTEIRYL